MKKIVLLALGVACGAIAQTGIFEGAVDIGTPSHKKGGPLTEMGNTGLAPFTPMYAPMYAGLRGVRPRRRGGDSRGVLGPDCGSAASARTGEEGGVA